MRATIPRSDSNVCRPGTLAEAVSRYDLVLAVIPLAIVGGVLLGATGSVPEPVGVGGGGVVAFAATAYALFGDPPIQPVHHAQHRGSAGARADGGRSGRDVPKAD